MDANPTPNLTLQEKIAKLMVWLKDRHSLEPDAVFHLTRDIVEAYVDRPRTTETQRKEAEKYIWAVLGTMCRPFFSNGVGYLLPLFSNLGRIEGGVPFAVTRDDNQFSFLLFALGIHPGGPMHRRVGEYIHNMCSQWGTKTQTRLGFHFEPQTFTAYAASRPGYIIKITRHGLEEITNGEDGQLFLYPDNFQPLFTRPFDEVDDNTFKFDLIRRSLIPDGYLVKHLFGGTSFEIRSMTERQVQRLIMAYVLFLMMPGVVSERAMLQALGPSGSGKTFLLELLGHLLVGPKFSPRPMPEDIREFENQLINEYFIVYDNVSKVPHSVKDRFCQAVTGMEIVRRILFTTSDEARFPSRSTLALSAITPPLPELEHQNRTISINFAEREEQGFIAKEELFKVIDRNRDYVMLNLLRRMCLVLEALAQQQRYVPKVNVRLASIATFMLRIARHEGWESDAHKLLDAWAEEQTGYALMEDDISIAMTRYVGRNDWQPNVELSATMLNSRLIAEMLEIPQQNLNWQGNHLALAKMISRNLKVYASRFGLERGKSKLPNTRGTHTYRFNPSPELLAEIKKEASYHRQGFIPAQEGILF